MDLHFRRQRAAEIDLDEQVRTGDVIDAHLPRAVERQDAYEERVDIVETRRHGPGDTATATFWLENQRPAAWREKAQVAVTNSLEALSDEELEHETQMPISGRCRRRTATLRSFSSFAWPRAIVAQAKPRCRMSA